MVMRFVTKAALLLTITLPVALTVATGNPAEAAYQFKFQNCGDRVESPTTRIITNTNRQRIGDLYSPGGGKRVQIRNNAQQILGYIEKDGTITNPSRQRVGTIEELQ